MPNNVVQIGDTVYTRDKFYAAGEAAFWAGVSYHSNPHRLGSYRHSQWADGHAHASEIEAVAA